MTFLRIERRRDRPLLRRAWDWPRSAQVTVRSQSETAAALTLTEGRSQPGAVNMRYNNCVSRRSRGRPVSGDGNRSNRLKLREKLGALKPEFAFAGFDAVSTEINGWLGFETLVPLIHRRFPDMTSQLATLRRRVPTPYTGSVTQTTIMCSCRSPIRALTRHLMIGSCISVRMAMVPGVLSPNNTLIQLHNQMPYNRRNNVTRYHIQNGSS